MQRILQVIAGSGSLIAFAVMQVICFFLIINYGNNERRSTIARYTIGLFGGQLMSARQEVAELFFLQKRVDSLNAENARLRTKLENRYFIRQPYRDTFVLIDVDTLQRKIARPQYTFIAAEVVNNSVNNAGNWIVLNRGLKDGVAPNCGVVANDGLVGVVRHVNDEFAVVMSLLHRQTRISARHKKSGALGSLVWPGRSSQYMSLLDVPKDVILAAGDSIVTSGYSTMFPAGLMIGTITDVSLPSGSNAYILKVHLQHDMTRTIDVHVIKNLFQTQIDSLIQRINNEQ
jgi:rod shape-determining protein MreC